MKSTLGQLRDFGESFLWQDIVAELDVWLQMIRDGLENPDLNLTHARLDRLGGCAEAVRSFSRMIEVLTGLAEDDDSERKNAVNKLTKGGN